MSQDSALSPTANLQTTGNFFHLSSGPRLKPISSDMGSRYATTTTLSHPPPPPQHYHTPPHTPPPPTHTHTHTPHPHPPTPRENCKATHNTLGKIDTV